MKKNLLAFAIGTMLAGCTTAPVQTLANQLSPMIVQDAQTAQDVICKYIPIGVWQTLYASKAAAWSQLCNNPATTPAP